MSKIIRRRTSDIALVVGLTIGLWGCFPTSQTGWKTYTNTRYGFEFPYPSNWTDSRVPDNNDGIVFVSPQDHSVQIRGWATHQLVDANKYDFRTAQGISGVLVVETGQRVSSMTLTLTQRQVQYCFQGQSNAQEFSKYYGLFQYMAYQYRIFP